MLKGLVSLLLLALLDEGEDYGYSLVVRLRDGGLEEVAEGTVYPALARLEQGGWLSTHLVPSQRGPARKYYKITAAGRRELASQLDAWHRLAKIIDSVTEGTQQ